VVDLEREWHPELSKMLDIHDSNMSKSGHFCPQKKGFFHHLQGGGRKMMLLQQKQHFRYAFSQMNSYTKHDDDDVHEIHHPSARAAKPTILIFD
jgi:hypothetical protein